MYKIRMSVPRAHLNRTDWLNLISLKLPFGRSLRILPVSIHIVQSEMSTRTMLGVFAALPASPSNSYNLIPTHWSNLGLLAKTHWLPSKRVSKRYQNFSDSINGSASNTVKYHTIYKKSATKRSMKETVTTARLLVNRNRLPILLPPAYGPRSSHLFGVLLKLTANLTFGAENFLGFALLFSSEIFRWTAGFSTPSSPNDAARFLGNSDSGWQSDRISASTSERNKTPALRGDGLACICVAFLIRAGDTKANSKSFRSVRDDEDLPLGESLSEKLGWGDLAPLYSPDSSLDSANNSVKSPPSTLPKVSEIPASSMASNSTSMSNSVKDIRSPTGGGSGMAGCSSGSGRVSGTGAISQSSVTVWSGKVPEASPSRIIKSTQKWTYKRGKKTKRCLLTQQDSHRGR